MHEKTNPGWPAESPPSADRARVDAEVVRAIAASGRFPVARVEVSSSEGVVTLRGRVASYHHKQVAQAAALNVIGTRQLVNEIEVD